MNPSQTLTADDGVFDIIHMADTHLGYTQYHNDVREQDFIDAFNFVIETAIENSVDAVVHAGDLFHHSRPDFNTLSVAMDGINKLSDNDIPFLSITGNHDSSRSGDWIDLFESVDRAIHISDQPYILTKGNSHAVFYGRDYSQHSRVGVRDYTFNVPEMVADCNDDVYNIFVSHGPFSPFIPSEENDISDLFTYSNVDFNLCLLGDDHRNIIDAIDGVIVTYSGSSERTARDQPHGTINRVIFGRDSSYGDETERPRGKEYEIHGWTSFIDPIETQSRTFETHEIGVGSGESVDNQVKYFIEDIGDFDGSVVTVEIQGEGDVRSDISFGDLEDHIKSNGALYAKIVDKRDIESDETSISSEFSDPDEAVDEKLEQMDIDERFTTIDDIVRDESIAKTNVDDVAEGEVESIFNLNRTD